MQEKKDAFLYPQSEHHRPLHPDAARRRPERIGRLRRSGALSAKALYFNKSTVTRQIAALERQGLVRREPCPEDRRCQLVYPTERALEIVPKVRKLVCGWNDHLLAELSEDERDQLQALMERVSQRARDYIDREVGWDA